MQYVEPVEQYQPPPISQPVKYVKAPRPPAVVETYAPIGDPVDDYYFDEIEPTETDIGDGAELDEGTVNVQQREPVPVITQDRIVEKN